jgi:hypothetical protein
MNQLSELDTYLVAGNNVFFVGEGVLLTVPFSRDDQSYDPNELVEVRETAEMPESTIDLIFTVLGEMSL